MALCSNANTRFYGLFIIATFACLVTNMVRANDDSSERPGILYFGFFFDEETASSMKFITDSYFNASLSNLEDFSDFLQNVSDSANVTNIFEFYSKPLDPNSGEYDPLYHVTAKYCGENQKACSEYETKNSKFIDTKFEMHLVGYVLTPRTFGIRVNLTSEQKQLFDEENGKFISSSIASSTSMQSSVSSSLPGEIKFEQQEFPPSLPVTSTKAHATLGCAPGIPAVITGPDALKAIEYESSSDVWRQSWDFIPDPMDSEGKNMTVTLYKPTASSPPSDYLFVIYPRVKVVANATLERYFHKSTESGSSSVLHGAMCKSHQYLLLTISAIYLFHSKMFQYL